MGNTTWIEYQLGELLSYEQPTPYIVESTKYNDTYPIPVLTPGKSFILGYTNECSGIYDKLPVIIFDDFTTASRHVTFPFKVKSSAMKILTANPEIVNSKFIYYRMQIIDFDCSTHKRYWIQSYSKIKVHIPPLEEQRRIVARIEELFSELDAAVATLERTKEQLAVYRQAVLKEAFESLSHDTPYPFIKDVCHEVKVGIVIKPKQYYTDKPNGIRAFRSANVREFYVNDSDWVYLTEYGHEQNKRSEIHTGDVLVVRSGYPGTACVVPEEFNNCNAIDILIAVPNKDKITSEYLCAYTNSPHGRKLITEKKRGVAQAHLNVGGYSQMTIPVPDIETQKQIVDGIELKLSIYDNIMKTLDDSLQEAEAMRQSILKQAFAGEL